MGRLHFSAAQGLSQLPRRRQTATNLRHACTWDECHQRGHAVRAAPTRSALRATRCGSAQPASPLSPVRCSVLQSVAAAEYRPSQVPGVLARRCALCSSSARVGAQAPRSHGSLRIVLDGPSPAARPGPVRRSVTHAHCGHPLRGPSGLHNGALPLVPASRCAKAPLGAAHRFAPYG